MDALSLIRKKRRGEELSESDIQWLVRATVAGRLPGYQLAALLMVCCYEHLTYPEILALTRAFVASGTTLSWPTGARPVVDKHSTGGIGDKVSLILLPWLAACGLRIPKMSGRGLGITGGTIDKLESIPGFRVNLGQQELARLLEEVGCVVTTHSSELAPADKLFYALRDATDTVEELGLIAASVMSKKIALGAKYIVLDVKCGGGAFFQDLQTARHFSEVAIKLGQEFGRSVACVISSMQHPLGFSIGNALEVKEALQFAQQQRIAADLQQLCRVLGSCLMVLAGVTADLEGAAAMLGTQLESGGLWLRMTQWIAAQGGDLAAFEKSLELASKHMIFTVPAPQSGYISNVDALQLGELAHGLGAGRLTQEDRIDPLVGVEICKQCGDKVDAGAVLAQVYSSRSGVQAAVQERCLRAFAVTGAPCPAGPIVLDVVGM